MKDEFMSMRWNERIAVIMGMSGGVIGIIGALIGIIDVNNLYLCGKLLMIGLALVWGGCAFLPPRMLG